MAAHLRQVSPEVFYSDGGFLAADSIVVEKLKAAAAASPRRRARLCFHESVEAHQQEMLIVMHRDSYVRPHRHHSKVETLTVIEGRCDALLFDETGALTKVLPMSPAAEGGAFFYRMPPGLFHTLVFGGEWLVFIETTIGPFDPDTSESARWAPADDNAESGHAFLACCLATANISASAR